MNDSMGPPGSGDVLGTIVVIIGAILTLYTFVVAVRATLRPGETAGDHPKRLILDEDR
jgi:hypothetical protein